MRYHPYTVTVVMVIRKEASWNTLLCLVGAELITEYIVQHKKCNNETGMNEYLRRTDMFVPISKEKVLFHSAEKISYGAGIYEAASGRIDD